MPNGTLNQVAVRFGSAQDPAAPADTPAFLWASSHRRGGSGLVAGSHSVNRSWKLPRAPRDACRSWALGRGDGR